MLDESDDEDDGDQYRVRHLGADFDFSSLSEDGITATFTVDTEHLPEDLHPRARRRLREYLGYMDIDFPKHTVEIRRDVNDGPIPGLSIDYDKLELSCNWRELFNAFYTEEYLYHKFTADAIKKRESWVAELKSRVDRGELDPMSVMTKVFTAFGDDTKESRKLARRARICWQFKQKDGTEWDFRRDGDEAEERKCLAELQNVRFQASFAEFSDDGSEEDGGDEENKEEDEEDEWEDTDSDGDD